MTRPNVNVTVGGPKKPTNYTYKTVVLKSNLPFDAQVTEPNCIYVIKWDFDLKGETVTVPENCILEFEGGNIYNGTFSNFFDNDYYDISNFVAPGSRDITQALTTIYEALATKTRKYANGQYYTKGVSIYIPAGIWECDEVVFTNTLRGLTIVGEKCYYAPMSTVSGTVIVPKREGQEFIWKLGNDVSGESTLSFNVTIENITFSDFYNTTVLEQGALCIYHAKQCWFRGLQFMWLNGTCLSIMASYELDFDTINIRFVNGMQPNILFKEGTVENISQIRIGTIFYEQTEGSIIKSESGSHWDNTVINNIIGEWVSGYSDGHNHEVAPEDYDTYYDDAISVPMIDIEESYNVIINNINNQVGKTYIILGHTEDPDDDVYYKYDNLIKVSNNARIQITNIVTSIATNSYDRKFDVIRADNAYVTIGDICLQNTNIIGELYRVADTFRLYCNEVKSLSIGSIRVVTRTGMINLSSYLDEYNAYKYVVCQEMGNSRGVIMYDELLPGLHLGIKPVKQNGYIMNFPPLVKGNYLITLLGTGWGISGQSLLQYGPYGNLSQKYLNVSGAPVYKNKDGVDYYLSVAAFDGVGAVNEPVDVLDIEDVINPETHLVIGGHCVYIVSIERNQVTLPTLNSTIQYSFGIKDNKFYYGNMSKNMYSPVLLKKTSGSVADAESLANEWLDPAAPEDPAVYLGAMFFLHDMNAGLNIPLFWDGACWRNADGTPLSEIIG